MTNMSKEAMKLALEAAYLAGFNDSAEGYNGEYPFRDHGATPTKDRHWVERRDAHIREAMAEQPAQQQEPVVRLTVPESHTGLITLTMSGADKLPPGEYVCYTSPLANANAGKPWVELDHDDIHALMNEFFYRGMQPSGAHFANFARAIEAKLREKNA